MKVGVVVGVIDGVGVELGVGVLVGTGVELGEDVAGGLVGDVFSSPLQAATVNRTMIDAINLIDFFIPRT